MKFEQTQNRIEITLFKRWRFCIQKVLDESDDIKDLIKWLEEAKK